jgi:hypothetical protein
MTTPLQRHIHAVSTYGTHRVVVKLTGKDITLKPMMQALKAKLSYTLDSRPLIVWFKTRDGMIVMVAGDQLVTSVVPTHFEAYEGVYEESTTLYAGRGSKVFCDIIVEQMKHYLPSRRSFASSR